MATEKAAAAPVAAAPTVEAGDVDVVAMVSLRADGTPDQTPGFVVIADPSDDNV